MSTVALECFSHNLDVEILRWYQACGVPEVVAAGVEAGGQQVALLQGRP